MPRYSLTDPVTGRTLTLTGDHAPSQSEVVEILKEHRRRRGVSTPVGVPQTDLSQPGSGFIRGGDYGANNPTPAESRFAPVMGGRAAMDESTMANYSPPIDVQSEEVEGPLSYLSRSPAVRPVLNLAKGMSDRAGQVGRNVLENVGAAAAGGLALSQLPYQIAGNRAERALNTARYVTQPVFDKVYSGFQKAGDVVGNAAGAVVRAITPPKIPVPAGRVRVQAPDGTIGTIPEKQLDSAKKKGYKVVE